MRIALLFILTVWVLACCKEDYCGEKEVHRYYFTHEDTTSLPYNGYDSIWFEVKDSSGTSVQVDTVLFLGQGKVRYMESLPQESSCPEDNGGQYMRITFINTITSDPLRIIFQRKAPYCSIRIEYISDFFIFDADGLHGKFGYQYPTITIGGKTYSNVSSSLSTQYNRTLANVEKGILSLELKPNLKLTLISLK